MGCDIHAMMEYRHPEYDWWINGGDPLIDRNYLLFSVLANVRNYDDVPFIQEGRGIPDNASDEMEGFYENWLPDAHSPGWVTLAEMKAYDLDQEYDDSRLILGYTEEGEISSVCRSTTGNHFGRVGRRKVFEVFGRKQWDSLIEKLESLPGDSDDKKRLVFFFDN